IRNLGHSEHSPFNLGFFLVQAQHQLLIVLSLGLAELNLNGFALSLQHADPEGNQGLGCVLEQSVEIVAPDPGEFAHEQTIAKALFKFTLDIRAQCFIIRRSALSLDLDYPSEQERSSELGVVFFVKVRQYSGSDVGSHQDELKQLAFGI